MSPEDREALPLVPAPPDDRATRSATPRRVERPDRVDASGADSFPASDPPSWWSGP